MQISAQERGRRLVLTVGGPTSDMSEEEAAEATADAVRISVPPVSARVGSQLFAFYAGLAFARQASLDSIGFEGTPEQAVERMTKLALGALELPDTDGGSEQQRVIARHQWDTVQELRWDEAQHVCNAALFWNVQGGGMDAVRAVLDDSTDSDGNPAGGIPKAQDLVMRANGLSRAASQLQSLLDTELSIEMLSADTPSGSDESSPSDATEPSPISEKSTERSASKSTTTSRPRSRRPSSGTSTRTSSGASRSSTGTTSPQSTSTSGSGGTTKTSGSGTTGRGSSSTPASGD